MNRAHTLILVACLAFSTVAFNAAADETKDIPDNAAATGVHDSLVAALDHVNLTETLQGDGPFTVFAPTDEAFAAAGINLEDFDNDTANATLKDILLYHVVAGAVPSGNVTDGMVATMVSGANATFTVDNGTVMINDANVTTPDVNASNGIIHVIDKVLMPPADEPVEEVVDPFEGIECAATVGIDSSGYAFSQTVVNIQPGETVCCSGKTPACLTTSSRLQASNPQPTLMAASPQGPSHPTSLSTTRSPRTPPSTTPVSLTLPWTCSVRLLLETAEHPLHPPAQVRAKTPQGS